MAEVTPAIDIHKSLPLRQSEVDYVPVSPETGTRQCANCRFFCPAGTWINGDQVSIPTCALVENYPLAILATGFCNRHEMLPENANEFPPMEVVIVDVDAERSYQSPVPVQPGMLQRWFGSKAPPATHVWRSASGLREGVIVTSNGYKDRENEHVATEALKDYVRGCYDEDGNWKGNNRFVFYHGIDIGEVVAAGVVKGFLVEIVRERSGIVPEILWDYWQETGTDRTVQWGASHGFLAKRQGDTFVRIDKKETTVLDVADAANLATYSGVLPMSNESKHLDAAFAKRGIKDASKLIAEKGLNAVVDELTRLGEVAKGAGGNSGAGTPPAPAQQTDYTKLFELLMETIDEQAGETTALKATVEALKQQAETRQKAADTTASDVQALKAGLEAQTKRLDGFLADTPERASESTRTKLSSDDEAKAKADIEKRTTQFDPSFGSMNVPLPEGGK